MVAAVLLFPVQASAISAEKAVVMDAVTGRILYERRSGERSRIASTTKIMTALVVCENCGVLEQVKIPGEAVGVEGSSMYLKEGEILTVQELLYGLMLRSGNDAAVALAISCGGSVEGFARMMNEKARELGLSGTHFANPHGLDAPEHYSTARDLAVLGCEAMKNPIFAQTVSTRQVRIGDRVLTNHNKLLWQLEGADGIKTGYTRSAGRLLVSSAVRQGRRLVCVTVRAPDDWQDHRLLLEQGFSGYHLTRVIRKGQVLGTAEVLSGTRDRVSLTAGCGFDYPLAPGEQVSAVLPPERLYAAPVSPGDPAGSVNVCLGKTVVGTVPLVFGGASERIQEEEKPLWRRIFGG